jgi:adenylate cyclase
VGGGPDGQLEGPHAHALDHGRDPRRSALQALRRAVRPAGAHRPEAHRGGPVAAQPRLCKLCIKHLHEGPGGTEIEVTVFFADVRGSTTLAEQMRPEEYSRLIARFYGAAAKVIDDHDGLVDKFVGDEAVALFIPGFAGNEHANRAIDTGRELLERTRDWIPVGVGIHTGVSFVGTVGEGDAVDFTALGDTVNAASRISGMAGADELLVSAMTAEAAGLETDDLERGTLELRGREQPVDVWVASAPQPVAVTA